ncbi:Uncharacterised protein [Vibrio cholerae]|uniref:Uncharacterized protein n=1 Tax=Vibrio cholerae TaxID=666 RepID=A0A656AF37_VIBCL|nr:Uncharacterised protein [Vibrio cholerae]CSB66597.1 Uncharacterised protein [Vibrio cholerae]CSC01153.1 Uncharacterised protein [Vibrio cholerae]CSC25138.1 Uncharacterised protein [Vibrio cholerae]CSD10540.1 Uncharacterised protein [Vibrio cholerae]
MIGEIEILIRKLISIGHEFRGQGICTQIIDADYQHVQIIGSTTEL